jgi:signal transduction histidine kinase
MRFQALIRGFPIFSSTRIAAVVIWVLLAAIAFFDVNTTADNVSVGFIYTVPLFLSLFESRPRSILYAAVTTILTGIGLFIPPPADQSMAVAVANRVIAILTQWLVAALVLIQHRRLSEAHEKADLQRRFLDILSHEIGTALTTVQGQSYRLQKLSAQITPDDVLRRAEKIRTAAQRIQAIVRRVQFASSLGDDTIPIGDEPVDVGELLRQLVEQTRDDRADSFIQLSLPPAPERVLGDEILLRHVFENILGNSIKYSPPGGAILVEMAPTQSMIRITVEDHGGGIAEEDLPRIRSAYYRGKNSAGTSGAGLGLYVAERVVKAHRGRLTIESEEGKGTKVTIDLPQSRDGAVA